MARLDWYIRANLKLRHLQLLVALDDVRNVGKVASMMNVTQPALSKALAELQSGLGCKLFERTGRGLAPTPYGVCLIQHARKVLTDLSDAGDELHSIATGTARKVKVGTLPASASWLLPRALVELKRKSPETSVFVRESTMDALMGGLRSGEIDLLVGTLPPRKAAQDLEELALLDDATSLIVRPDHPLANIRQPTWSQLAEYPWVLPPQDSLLREPLLVAFSANGVMPPTDFIETLSNSVTVNYVRMCMAVASLPATLAHRYCSEGIVTVLPFRLSRLVRPVGVVTLRSQPKSPGTLMVIECLQLAAQGMIRETSMQHAHLANGRPD